MRNRPRRLRYTPQIRALVKETPLSTTDLVMPVFIQNNKIKQEMHNIKHTKEKQTTQNKTNNKTNTTKEQHRKQHTECNPHGPAGCAEHLNQCR